MIIDCHTHLGNFNNKKFDEKDLVASMDEAKIDYSIILANLRSGEEDRTTDTETIIDICSKNPRLKAIGNVDFAKIDSERIEVLKQYLIEKKIVAIKLYPGYQDFYPNDRKLNPLYHLCQELGKPVVFHTGVLRKGSSGLLKQVRPIDIDEIANEFPKLKIVMAHMGNPWILDTAAVMLKNKYVFTDVSAFFEEYVSIAFREVEAFHRQLELIRSFYGDLSKCLFGSDWPIYSQKEYYEALEEMSMSDDERDLVFWKNAKEIFQLDI